MTQVHIINGPNLNLLGKRQPEIYGSQSFETYFVELKENNPNLFLHYYQSNVEGEIINYLQKIGFENVYVILNAGGYTHTSIAIADCCAAVTCPLIEVHLSQIYSRESYRHVSLISPHAQASISGMGLYSYQAALHFITYHASIKA